jgi:hypothetical protein
LTRRDAWVVGGLVGIGLAIRLFMLSKDGTQDLGAVLVWGDSVDQVGLSEAYFGIYFPLEWQILGAAVDLSHLLDVSGIEALKGVNLVFEIVGFALLVCLLRIWELPRRYALLYWLAPYFLVMSWLGYVDPQISCVLLGVLVILARWETPGGFLAAGVVLGIGFMMKPQFIPVVGVIPMLVAASLVVNPADRIRNLRPLLLLVGPAVLFVGYTAFFVLNGWTLTHLANTYRPDVLEVYALGLNANLLTFWLPVAQALSEPDQALFQVTEPDWLNTFGTVAALALLSASVFVIAKRRPVIGSREVFLAFLFVTLILPMVMTRGHENHLYLGSVLAVILAAAVRDRVLTWSLVALFLISFFNIFARYGFGADYPDNAVVQWATGLLFEGSELYLSALALISTGLVVVVCWYAVGATRNWRPVEGPHDGP